MNKAYDILLNFKNEVVLPFYEWQESDDIVHADRISFIKINNQTWLDIKSHQGNLGLKLLKKDLIIPSFSKKKALCGIPLLLTSNLGVMGVLINQQGKILKKSGLLLDEERELMELNNVIEESLVTFKKGSKLTYNYELTLQENELLSTYKKILKTDKRPEKLQYWYFEIFGKEESDPQKIIKHLEQTDDLDLIRRRLAA